LIQYTPLMISNNKRQYEPPGQESETWDTEAMAIMGGGCAEIPKDRIKANPESRKLDSESRTA
jgi:hypothetical protein